MKVLVNIQNQFDQWLEQLHDYLSRLSLRERIMVIAAGVVVIVAIVGSALWRMHVAAEEQQKRLNELKDTLVWMQTNVVTMKPAADLQLSAAEKIQRVAQQTGISLSSQEKEGIFLIAAEHEHYAVLANFLTQLVQMGLSVEKLELMKAGPAIKLTASVH